MFDDVLAEVERELDIPYPMRARVPRWTEGQLVAEHALVGFTEALSSVIVGATLATLIILVQAALQSGLRAMEVKSAA